ncbi:hypothetical protein V8C42DRAFT_88949 [Trichoderma barbatum]
MATFHERSCLDEMNQSNRPQAVFEGSQNSPSPTGRHLHGVPTRSTWDHRAQLGRLSQPDPSSFHYHNQPNEMGNAGRSQEEIRGWTNSISFPRQFAGLPPSYHPQEPDTNDRRRTEMQLASPFHDGSHLDEETQRDRRQRAFRNSQSSPSFTGRQMDMGTAQSHMSTDFPWRGSSEEMARDLRNSSSPTGQHMDMGPNQSRMTAFDDIFQRGSSDATVRGFQNSSSPVSRRLPVPPGTLSTNHEVRRFSASSSLQTDSGEDVLCTCTPEPPRPQNSFMLFRQHHQSSVAKQYKGLSNPEISKIIGIMWKKAADDEREMWTQLAEEEKKLHAIKYPNYRYRPNRRPKSQGKQNKRCSKCGGRVSTNARSAGSPTFPGSPESAVSAQSPPSSRTPRAPRTSRGSRGSQGPRTPRTPGPLPTPITPFAASNETSFTTPVSSTGRRNSESFPWPPLNTSSTSARRHTGITPSSLHRISEQREPRSPRDYGSASPDRRRRRTNDAGDYCAAGNDFDDGRRTERAGLTFDGRLATPVMPEPASFPRSRSLSTLPPLPLQQGTDPRESSLFGDPPRLPALEPPLPQTPLWPSLANYSIYK